MVSGPAWGAPKNVATRTVGPSVRLTALWTWSPPASINAVPAGYSRSTQSSAPTYVSSPTAMLTTTGPGWVCQPNCAPGCTVILAVTVREGSLTFTTRVALPSSLILNLRSTSSVNTARPVNGSTAMGGGGSCAADGSTFAPIRRTAIRPQLRGQLLASFS